MPKTQLKETHVEPEEVTTAEIAAAKDNQPMNQGMEGYPDDREN